MQGKIRLKLNRTVSIRNNRYEVFLNGEFIGAVDYKNPKIDYIVNFGKHKILVKGKNSEREYNLDLNSRKIVQRLELNENLNLFKSENKFPKVTNLILNGALIIYILFIGYLLIFKNLEFKIYHILPLFLIVNTFIYQRKYNDFDINFK